MRHERMACHTGERVRQIEVGAFKKVQKAVKARAATGEAVAHLT
jgi:hypothetical protein